MKIKIVTDSTCCLPKSWMDEKGISYLESKIIIDDKEFKDLSDLNREEFIQSLELLEPYPKTTLASPQEALEIFEQAIKEGYDTILYLGLSPTISNQFNSAKIAAKRVRDKANIHLFQTGLMGASQGAMTYYAWKLLEQGKDIEEILAKLEELKHKIHTVGFSKDFDTLFRTGKIKKGVGITIIASVLKLHPIFQYKLDQGVISVGGGVGFKGAVNKLIQNIEENTKSDIEYELIFSDALTQENQLKYIEHKVKKIRKITKVHYWHIPPVVAHTLGKGAIQVTLMPKIQD